MSRTRAKRSPKRAADPATSDYQIEDSPFYQIARLNGRYMFGMEKALKAVGMDIPRWRVLMVLHDKSPSSISEISERSFTRLSTMTRVAQRMAKDGYLDLRTASKDARITEAHITEKGEQAVEVIRGVASRVFNVAFADYSDKDITELNRLLTQAYNNLAILR